MVEDKKGATHLMLCWMSKVERKRVRLAFQQVEAIPKSSWTETEMEDKGQTATPEPSTLNYIVVPNKSTHPNKERVGLPERRAIRFGHVHRHVRLLGRLGSRLWVTEVLSAQSDHGYTQMTCQL